MIFNDSNHLFNNTVELQFYFTTSTSSCCPVYLAASLMQNSGVHFAPMGLYSVINAGWTL